MRKKSTAKSAFLNPRGLVALVVCATAACSVVSGTLPAMASKLIFLRTEAPLKLSYPAASGLTFAERVAYQRAIEEVYRRQRLWPRGGEERPDPNVSLDAVMSQAELEKKVADYLRKSQALEDYWQLPITAEQLQAEMDRMARHTRQPKVLHELFAALDRKSVV